MGEKISIDTFYSLSAHAHHLVVSVFDLCTTSLGPNNSKNNDRKVSECNRSLYGTFSLC